MDIRSGSGESRPLPPRWPRVWWKVFKDCGIAGAIQFQVSSLGPDGLEYQVLHVISAVELHHARFPLRCLVMRRLRKLLARELNK